MRPRLLEASRPPRSAPSVPYSSGSASALMGETVAKTLVQRYAGRCLRRSDLRKLTAIPDIVRSSPSLVHYFASPENRSSSPVPASGASSERRPEEEPLPAADHAAISSRPSSSVASSPATLAKSTRRSSGALGGRSRHPSPARPATSWPVPTWVQQSSLRPPTSASPYSPRTNSSPSSGPKESSPPPPLTGRTRPASPSSLIPP